ncbi:tigger transposable element-derived protein 6-like [Sphaeramia orbicularis]|uniref:tigger transposable element-derived protein 6-like n=1 Tax=Sphaeramia orbicularis TaxID=375764 RepID=UPI00117C4340|nr:tigger transposable element-derived protein 6-like [Sphaeramia orbicularis]
MKRRTVGDILAQKEKWLESTDDNPFRRNRQAKNEGMEKALFLWFSGARARNLPVTDDVLRAKGKELGEKLGVTDFAYSSGWLTRFKKRFVISNRVISGESAGIDPEAIDAGWRKAKTVIAKYKPEDVFNMDETGLYYRMLPDRTLTLVTSTKGIKKAKIRISLALTANATGTEKLTPLVIGHAQRPSHIVPVDDDGQPKLTNVDVHFLPPTTTSHLQPMDAGIIKAFKAHYRRFQVRHMIDAYDAGWPTEIQPNHAIHYVKQAWNAITEKTIVNCWEHVKIFPDRTPAADADVEVLDPVPAPLQNDFGNMFECMAEMYTIPPEHAMSESEFISVDDGLSTGEELTEEEIINIVVGPSSDPGNEDEDADDIDIEPQRPPTSCEAKAALDVVVRFLESKTPADGVMKKVMDISSEINNLIKKSTKQSAITDFFKSQ